MFLVGVHTVPVFVSWVSSPLKDKHVIHRRSRHFTAMFCFRTRFLLLLLRVSTRLQLDLMESVISAVCLCLCYFVAWVAASTSDHYIRFSGDHPVLPHAPWTGADEKHEWQDSWLSEQLMKMVRREQDSKKWTIPSFFFFFPFLCKGETERWRIQICQETQR